MKASRLALPLLLLAHAACGGDAPPEAVPQEATIRGVHGVAPAATGGTPSVVTLRGSSPAPAAGSETPRIDQLGLVFTPTQLVVRVGQAVVFSNSEAIAHNVHVHDGESGETVFNEDTDPGARAQYTFDREGGYEITCDLHPGMRAFVYATTAPYAVLAERTGEFVIPDVPDGAYTLSVWSVDPSRRSEQQITVSGPSTEVRIGG